MDSKYYDLNVPRSAASPEMIARLLDCEYIYIGITTTVCADDFNFAPTETGKKKSQEERQEMRKKLVIQLSPLSPDQLNSLLVDSRAFRCIVPPRPCLLPPRLFNRLNIVCKETETMGLFFKEFDEAIRVFDLVTFEPQTQQALAYAIETASIPVDAIVTDTSRPADFRPSSKQCAQCLKRGICFEVNTAQLFRHGAGQARNGLASLLTNLASVCQFHFSRLICLSSGARSGWEVRRPQALASIFKSALGASPTSMGSLLSSQGLLAMQQANPHQLLARGLSRSRTTHAAAILLRLLADPTITSISMSSTSTTPSTPSEDSNQPPPCKKAKMVAS